MKYFNRTVATLAVLIAVLAPALAAGAQSVDSPAYWETQFQHEAVCHPSSDTGHGSVSDDGLTVVLFEFDLTWTYGDHWEGLVVFAGDDHVAYEHPEVGVPYAAPGGAAVTDWIVCKGVSPETTTTTTTAAPDETTTTAAPEETTTTTAAPGETTTTTAAPEGTTSTSAAPAGGVATGAGGTAGSDQPVLLILLGVAAITAMVGAGSAARRRSGS